MIVADIRKPLKFGEFLAATACIVWAEIEATRARSRSTRRVNVYGLLRLLPDRVPREAYAGGSLAGNES